MSDAPTASALEIEVRSLLVLHLHLDADLLVGHALIQDWRHDGDTLAAALSIVEGHYDIRLPASLLDPLTSFRALVDGVAAELERRSRRQRLVGALLPTPGRIESNLPR